MGDRGMTVQEEFIQEVLAEAKKENPKLTDEDIISVVDGFWRIHSDLAEKNKNIRYYKTGKLVFKGDDYREARAKAKQDADKAIRQIEEEKGVVTKKDMAIAYRQAYRTNFEGLKPLENRNVDDNG